MSTGLFENPELGADEVDFDWEAFAPDADLEGQNRELDLDEDDPELDDSEFEWDNFVADSDESLTAVRDQRESAADIQADEGDEEAKARALAALERIQDDVRGTPATPSPLPPSLPQEAPLPATEIVSEASDTDLEAAPVQDEQPVSEASDTDLDVAEPEAAPVDEAPVSEAADTDLDVAEPEAAPVDEAPVSEAAVAADPETAPVSEELPVSREARERKPSGPAHARARRGDDRRRLYTVAVTLVCAILVAILAFVVVRSLHRTPTPSTGSHVTAVTAVPTDRLDTSQIVAATDEAVAATTEARAGSSAFSDLPTVGEVAAVVNPYVTSLRLYASAMSALTVPQQARSAAQAATSQASQDATFLGNIDGLPPIQLGTFLQGFLDETAQLQAAFSALQASLAQPPAN